MLTKKEQESEWKALGEMDKGTAIAALEGLRKKLEIMLHAAALESGGTTAKFASIAKEIQAIDKAIDALMGRVVK